MDEKGKEMHRNVNEHFGQPLDQGGRSRACLHIGVSAIREGRGPRKQSSKNHRSMTRGSVGRTGIPQEAVLRLRVKSEKREA